MGFLFRYILRLLKKCQLKFSAQSNRAAHWVTAKGGRRHEVRVILIPYFLSSMDFGFSFPQAVTEFSWQCECCLHTFGIHHMIFNWERWLCSSRQISAIAICQARLLDEPPFSGTFLRDAHPAGYHSQSAEKWAEQARWPICWVWLVLHLTRARHRQFCIGQIFR